MSSLFRALLNSSIKSVLAYCSCSPKTARDLSALFSSLFEGIFGSAVIIVLLHVQLHKLFSQMSA
jgi:hypothetical protein